MSEAPSQSLHDPIRYALPFLLLAIGLELVALRVEGTIGKLPRPIEFIFNTPSHHRVHHGSDALRLDRNYGGVFIIWDRRFGTFQAEEHRPTYGLITPIHTNNLVRLQFHEYAAMLRDIKGAQRFRDRLGFVFGPPGWQPAVSEDVAPSSPAGSELTTVAR